MIFDCGAAQILHLPAGSDIQLSFYQWQNLLGLLTLAQDLTMRGRPPLASSDMSSLHHHR